MTTKEALKEIEHYYNNGLSYYEFRIISGVDEDGDVEYLEFKIRMNKDHSWKSKNNDDSVNCLSLVNRPAQGQEQDYGREIENIYGDITLHNQYYNVLDVEDVLSQVKEFISDVKYINQ